MSIAKYQNMPKSLGAALFGQRLLETWAAAKRAGMTQVKLAERMTEIGVPTRQTRVSELLSLPHRATLEEIEAMALAFDLTGGALAFGEGYKAPKQAHPETKLVAKTKPAPRSSEVQAVNNRRGGR